MDMYGIKNCSTVKKARQFLDSKKIDYVFHDVKKEAPTKSQLTHWLKHVPWEVLLNRQGTTWRQLPDAAKKDMTKTKAIALMLENSSIIKRPVLEIDNQVVVGFDESVYNSLI